MNKYISSFLSLFSKKNKRPPSVFSWDSTFEVGIPIIDKQNRKSVALLNKLADCLTNGIDASSIIINELREYNSSHFDDEEAIWGSIFKGDDWYEKHKTDHNIFLLEVQKIINSQNISADTLVFLTKWLAFHIIDSDARMANVLFDVQAGNLLSISKDKYGINKTTEILIEKIIAMCGILSKQTINLTKELNVSFKNELTVQNSLDRMHKIADQMPGVMFQFQLFSDGTFFVPYVNDTIKYIYKFDFEGSVNDIYKILKPIHSSDIDGFTKSCLESYRKLSIWDYEYRLKFNDEIIWLHGKAFPCKQDDGSVIWHGFINDVSKQKIIENELSLAAIAFELQEAMIITDSKGIITKVNRQFCNITGYSKREAIGRNPNILSSGKHDVAFYENMWDKIRTEGIWKGEIWNRRKNGVIYPEFVTITAIKDECGNIVNYISVFTDITSVKASEEEIKRLAYYDPLTDLPNRRLLQERIKHSIEVENRNGNKFALLMLDLDRFKMVNDSYGHSYGDELLKQVSCRILDMVRGVDMVCRLGGDEFVILLEDISNDDDAGRVALDIIYALSKQFSLSQGIAVKIGASVGISLYPEHGCSYESLIDHADSALYKSKELGRGCYSYFSEDQTLAAQEKISLDFRLRKAIENNELIVFYQPQVDILTGKIIGAEALLRWTDSIDGPISPAYFIPIAEESGLILDIGEFVLREVCKQGAAWLKAGVPPITLAVNVSSKQFQRDSIFYLVSDILTETKFPAKYLELELTEGGLMSDYSNVVYRLNTLRDLGVRLAIDDFGTGFSSLSYLKNFPLDVLKIDKSFIDDIPNKPGDMEIVSTIISMGRILGFTVLAEGVETPDQLAFLKEQGCDAYQGYIKSKPLSADKFIELLREQYINENRHWRI